MGNYQSTREQNDKENFSKVCNIIPDVPNNNYVLWTNMEHIEAPPPFLDLRYSKDVAPFIFYKDPRILSSSVICAYLYNVLYTKFSIQWMANAEHIYLQSIISMYGLSPLTNENVEQYSLKELYGLQPDGILQHVNQFYISIENTLNTLQKKGVVEEKMPIPSISIPSFFDMKYYYLAKDEMVMKMSLFQENTILANLTIFSNFLNCKDGVISFPEREDTAIGMIAVMIVGYRNDGTWIARFPFGHRWGEHGYGYISNDYFERYNRDRWIIVIDSIKQLRNIDKENLNDSFTIVRDTSSSAKKEDITTASTSTHKKGPNAVAKSQIRFI